MAAFLNPSTHTKSVPAIEPSPARRQIPLLWVRLGKAGHVAVQGHGQGMHGFP